MHKRYTSLVVLGGLIAIIATAYFLKSITNLTTPKTQNKPINNLSFSQFKSDNDFINYIQNSANNTSFLKRDAALLEPTFETTDNSTANYSQTNVQVVNIDEPDIAKTNGKMIFYSPQNYYSIIPLDPMPLTKNSVSSSPAYERIEAYIKTLILSANNGELNIENEIDTSGEMLISNNILISFNSNYPNNKITAFNIVDTKNPTLMWEKNLENSQIISSRLFEKSLYLITNNYPDFSNPCPIYFFENKIACTDIYYPSFPIDTQTVTTISKINTTTGEIENTVSFVSSFDTTIYMSTNNIYIAYTNSQSYQDFYLSFYTSDEANNFFNDEINNKIANLKYYDISNEAKYTEINYLIEKFKSNLKIEERSNFEQDLNNQIDKFAQKRSRELLSTSLIKINNNNLNILNTTNIPGKILNQFSLDEFDENIRIATTIENNFTSSDNFKNDLYILNKNLEKIGEYLDYGEGERIYSVRFIENKAYIVTFKQVDPFFIFDLSNPKNPIKTGELKIPGYSSYLHQLSDNLILGIGKENDFLKLSLFDVSNPSEPIELSNYVLENEYYSEILDNHKAFTINKANNQFFIPSINASYIFTYKNNKLELLRKINQQNLKRAIYIDSYYYFLSDQKATSYDFTNLNLVDELNF